MAAHKITLYVDIVSPFAWLAYYMFRHSPAFKTCEITYVPVFLGGLMKMCDNRPPLVIKNKVDWIDSERKLWANMFSIPVASTAPDGFPVNTISIQRTLTALQQSNPSALPAALDHIWMKFWGPERNAAGLQKGESLLAALRDAVGQDAAERAVKDSTSDEVKKALAANTERAFRDGAFGLPHYVARKNGSDADKMSFWGFDRMGVLIDFLGLERASFGLGGEGMRAML